MNRTDQLLRNITKEMEGIEIGPFYNPVLPKSEGWKTTIVDFTDQAALLEIANNHEQQSIRDAAHKIEKVDIVWNGADLDKHCLKGRREGYDFLLASHVIEHIPNLISFMQQVSRLLKPGGIISLAVPDMRYCFDFFRAPSSTARVLAAYRIQPKIHQPETIFEKYATSALIKDAGAWIRTTRDLPRIEDDLFDSYAKYQDYAAKLAKGKQDYVDAHCWQFTPSLFRLIMLELNCLGLIDFHVKTIEENLGSEFIVQMYREKVSLTGEALLNERNKLHYGAIAELSERALTMGMVNFRNPLE